MSPVSISLWVVVCRQVVSHSLHPLHRHLFLGKVGHHYTVAITVSVVVSPILFFSGSISYTYLPIQSPDDFTSIWANETCRDNLLFSFDIVTHPPTIA